MPAPAARTALTIGNFDGVHIGHAALVHRAREEVGEGGRVVALAFDPHPAAVLAPGREPPRLTTFEQRAALLRAIGADEVVRLDPASGVLGQEAAAFLAGLVERFAPTAIVEGPDFRFGRGRAGDLALIRDEGRRLGFAVHTVVPVEVALTDQSIVRASSSVVRWLLSHGRVRDAAFVLGRPYELTGEVVPGDRRGRTIGVPTANLAAEQTLPADAVYAALATLPDGGVVPAAVNVGARPTVAGTQRRAEAHLLLDRDERDFSPVPGQPEYRWPLQLSLVGWVRDEARFPSLDALRGQIARDLDRVRALTRPMLEQATA